jgi:hypothetical protein
MLTLSTEWTSIRCFFASYHAFYRLARNGTSSATPRYGATRQASRRVIRSPLDDTEKHISRFPAIPQKGTRMKPIGILALSAAAILAAGTMTADAAPHGGGGHFGGGGAAHFAAPHAGGGNFGAARVGAANVGGGNFAAAQVQGGNFGTRSGYSFARSGFGRGAGLGLAAAGAGYGLSYAYGGYGYGAYDYPGYAYGYGDTGYGYSDPAYAYADGGDGVNYADAPQYSPLRTGRSAAYGGLGRYCTTSVKTCALYEPSPVGAECSCKVPGGRAPGDVTP